MHREENLTHASFPSIMKESTSALEKTTTLHHEGKLAHASFPYSESTTALPKTTLHHEGNLMHASFLFIMK